MSFSETNRELLLFLTGGEEPIFVSPTFDPMETCKERFRNEFPDVDFSSLNLESNSRFMEILLEENARARKEMDEQGTRKF